mgnify:CR=1 FL=1
MSLAWGNEGPPIRTRDLVRNLNDNRIYIAVSVTPLVLKDLVGNTVKEVQPLEYRHIGTFNKTVTL